VKKKKIFNVGGTAVPGQCRCGEAQAARDAIELDQRDELVDWRDGFDLAR
jgi:hypothetical protein